MCGIVGRVNVSRDKAVCADELRAATRAAAHRGPDGEGLYCRGPVGLGHRRLSIVDIAGGAQPMSDLQAQLHVVFNGEIYNHDALRRELTTRGAVFRSRSDTEVLLHAYLAWGDEFVSRLRGMFAFALWDARRQRLLVARDRVGIKPLYWTRTSAGDLVFASEVKSLFGFSDVPRALGESHLPAYLALRYVPGADTLFRDVHRLEPGHLMVFEHGQLAMRRYWDVPVDQFDPQRRCDMDEESDRLEQLLKETVRSHLMGEVPVGLFLSGGIDSTAVGWAMRATGLRHFKTFSVGFDTEDDSELVWARRAADALESEHREVKVSALDFRDALPELVWHLDEPNADGACVPLMYLARRAREEVTVVLSGEGADEILGGYGIYGRLLGMDAAQRWGGGVTSAAARASLAVVRAPRWRKYLRMLGGSPDGHYLGVGRGFGDELLAETFGDSALEDVRARFAPLWARCADAPLLNQLLYVDTARWLPDDLLVKADKMTMRSAVELRVPFLDHEMIENAWRLPPSLKIRRGTRKFLLRRMLKGKIPQAILDRPKRGFPVPLSRWLRTSLHGACRDRLLSVGSAVRGLLGPAVLQRLLNEHRAGTVDRTEELYSLWVFEEWHRAWLSPSTTRGQRNVLRTDGGAPELARTEIPHARGRAATYLEGQAPR